MQTLTFKTERKLQAMDLTRIMNDILIKNFYEEGILSVFCTHTTCSVAVVDLDQGTEDDYLTAYSELIPKLNYKHPHNPSHFPEHLMSSLVGVSVIVPVQSASLAMGSMQKLVLFEFSGPRDRHITINFISTKKN